MLNNLFKRATSVQALLKGLNVPFTFIGGIANAIIGDMRTTIDADLLILVPDEELEAFILSLSQHARLRPQNPIDFAMTTRIIPAEFPDGFRVDFILAGLDFEKDVIKRSLEMPSGEGGRLQIATAEDLIIMKIISTRPKDREDVKGIVARQAGQLDLAYIHKWLKLFEQSLDRSDLIVDLNKLIAER